MSMIDAVLVNSSIISGDINTNESFEGINKEVEYEEIFILTPPNILSGGNTIVNNYNTYVTIISGTTPVEVGFKPKDSIFVSSTNPLADFTDLGQALIYAKTNINFTFTDRLFLIYVDSGTYTLSGCDISTMGIDDVSIEIIGVNSSDINYTRFTGGRESNTYIVLDCYNALLSAVKLKNTYLTFKNCSLFNSNTGTMDTDNACFLFQSGGIFFEDCKIQFVTAPSLGNGSITLAKASSLTGIFSAFSRCHINVIYSRGIADKTYSFIDFTGTSHPYIFFNDNYINLSLMPPANSSHAVFYNARNADTSTTPYSFGNKNSVRCSISSASFSKTFTFWKGSCIGTVANPIFFEKNTLVGSNPSSTGKLIWFDYDSNTSNGTIKLSSNIFTNEQSNSSIILSNVGSGDTVKMNGNMYEGTFINLSGAGTMLNTSIGITPITTKTTDYTLLTSDYTVLANSSSPILFTIPSAIANLGKEYVLKNINTGELSISGTSGQTFDGAISGSLTTNQAWTIKSDGANYFIINKVV